MAVLERLNLEEGFTDVENKLATYILDNIDDVSRMNIAQLAEATFTSNASIVRLCRKLGLNGYRDLRIELAAEVERTRNATSVVDVNHPFSGNERTPAIMGDIAAVLKEAIDLTRSAVDPTAIDQAAHAIRESGLVYLFGSGDSRITAIAFSNMLLKIGVRSTIVGEYDDDIANISGIMPGDAALFVSYSGGIASKPSMRRVVCILKERRCPMLWLSAAPMPPAMSVELHLPAREAVHGKTVTFFSQMCIRYLLNCIYGAVYALDYEANTDKVNRVDELKVLLETIEAL